MAKMKKITVTGYIDENGKMSIHNQERLKDWMLKHPNQFFKAQFFSSDKRTNAMNSYYHAVLIPCGLYCLEEAGYNDLIEEDVHEIFKSMYNTKTIKLYGQVVKFTKSTTDLTQDEFWDNYVRHIRRFLKNVFHIETPDPNKDWRNEPPAPWKEKQK